MTELGRVTCIHVNTYPGVLISILLASVPVIITGPSDKYITVLFGRKQNHPYLFSRIKTKYRIYDIGVSTTVIHSYHIIIEITKTLNANIPK